MAINKINSKSIEDLQISADDLASGSISGAKLSTPFDYNSGNLYLDNTNSYVGIGETSPVRKIHVKSDQIITSLFESTNANYSRISFKSAHTSTIDPYVGAYQDSIRFQGVNHAFQNGATEYARIDSDGLKFNGDTAAANALDDYEEGTFTPVITSGYSTVTYAIQGGTYTKIGRQVFFTLRLELNPSGTSASAVLISIGGLPFTSASSPSGSFAGAGVFSYVNANIINSTTTNPPALYIAQNVTGISLYKTNGSQFLGTDLNSPTNPDFYITGTYITN